MTQTSSFLAHFGSDQTNFKQIKELPCRQLSNFRQVFVNKQNGKIQAVL